MQKYGEKMNKEKAKYESLEKWHLEEHLHLPRTGSDATVAFDAGWDAAIQWREEQAADGFKEWYITKESEFDNCKEAWIASQIATEKKLSQAQVELEAKMQKRIDVLKEALEFYANKENWDYTDSNGQFSQWEKIKNDCFDPALDEGGGHEFGGKCARKALAELERMEKEG